MKILVAEDDPLSTFLLKSHLASWNLDATFVSNGAEAWERYQSGNFAIIITDWMMPVMDGIELIRRIRGAAADYVYVLLLTAKSEMEDLVIGMDAGADDFLAKPFDQKELRVRLRAAERRLSLEQQLSEQNHELRAINERLRRDLEAAARVQRSLLPAKSPAMPGFAAAWEFQPCDELGGDCLNIFALDEDHIGFFVLDVSGHGVAASLLSVSLSRILLPSAMRDSLLFNAEGGIAPPHEVLERLSVRFQMNPRAPQYFTLCCGVLCLSRSTLTYASAGHPGPILLSNGSSRQLDGRGTPIGFDAAARYQSHTVELQPGDRFVVFSDGLTDAVNADDEPFGFERLMQQFGTTRASSLATSLSVARDAITAWCHPRNPNDDMSCLAIERLN